MTIFFFFLLLFRVHITRLHTSIKSIFSAVKIKKTFINYIIFSSLKNIILPWWRWWWITRIFSAEKNFRWRRWWFDSFTSNTLTETASTIRDDDNDDHDASDDCGGGDGSSLTTDSVYNPQWYNQEWGVPGSVPPLLRPCRIRVFMYTNYL